MNHSKLEGKIVEKYKTRAAFARELFPKNANPEAKLSNKLNGRSEWTIPEMRDALKALDVPITEVHEYFFIQ